MANKQNETKTQEVKQAASEPTYTVQEFAAAPHILGLKSPDIVKAALKKAGKDSFTVTEAKNIVNDFRKKEVK